MQNLLKMSISFKDQQTFLWTEVTFVVNTDKWPALEKHSVSLSEYFNIEIKTWNIKKEVKQ